NGSDLPSARFAARRSIWSAPRATAKREDEEGSGRAAPLCRWPTNAVASLLRRRFLHRNLERGRHDRAGLPGVERQRHFGHAPAAVLRGLDQALQAIASASLFERVLLSDRLLARLGGESDLRFRVGLFGNGVWIQKEGKRSGADALRANADLQHALAAND